MPRPSHFEVMADDPERAIAFYSALLGWSFTNWGGGEADYWLITTGPDDEPGINGGLMRRSEALTGTGTSAFICTSRVPDLDSTVATATENGGTVELPRMPVPGVGWLAYLRDTEGNLFGVIQEDASVTA